MKAMSFKLKTWAFIFGAMWACVGIMLLTVGLNLLHTAGVSRIGEEVAVLVIAVSLAVGYCKGKWVLQKGAKRTLGALEAYGDPIPFSKAFGVRYFVLIFVMMTLGFLLRFVDPAIRGAVDVAVGAALLQGSIVFFKSDYL